MYLGGAVSGREANQQPRRSKSRFHSCEHMSWMIEAVQRSSANEQLMGLLFFKKKINRTAFWGRVHRMEKLTKAHLLAFPEPRIHSARHRLSFCSIGLIRIRTWRAATRWEAPWYFFVNLNKNTWDFCQMTWHKHSRRNIMHNHQTVLCSI